MIQIQHPHLEQFALEHYENLKNKLTKFPSNTKYSLKEVITVKPDKLDEIADWFNALTNNSFKVPTRGTPTSLCRGNLLWLPSKSSYNFMRDKYKNFTTKKKEYDAYDLAKKLQVNICPYCNINHTFTIVQKNDEKITRPEFDHFYDKDTYPILALSFYNLIPSCHICNSTLKGRTNFSIKTHLNPYSDDFNKLAQFKLKIKNSKFYHSINGFKLNLESKDKRATNNIKDFKLQDLYQNHKDIVLELIQKNEIYNESYIDELMQNYEGTLFKNREDLLRHITCGYITDEEIGKRPLSKLIKDISQELGLNR
jgi:hypothetical protein